MLTDMFTMITIVDIVLHLICCKHKGFHEFTFLKSCNFGVAAKGKRQKDHRSLMQNWRPSIK